MTARGSVSQRHTRRCLRNPNGRGWAPHKCRGLRAWRLNLGVDPVTKQRRQATGSGYRTKDEAQAALDGRRRDLTVTTHGRAQGVMLGEWFDQGLDILRTALLTYLGLPLPPPASTGELSSPDGTLRGRTDVDSASDEGVAA